MAKRRATKPKAVPTEDKALTEAQEYVLSELAKGRVPARTAGALEILAKRNLARLWGDGKWRITEQGEAWLKG